MCRPFFYGPNHACSIFLLFSFSILLPQFPNSPKQILTTRSAFIFLLTGENIPNAFGAFISLKLRAYVDFWLQVEKWKENERSGELIAHSQIRRLPWFLISFVSQRKEQNGEL